MAIPQKKLQVTESIWLAYFNQVLFEKQLISEKERNQMALLIKKRSRP